MEPLSLGDTLLLALIGIIILWAIYNVCFGITAKLEKIYSVLKCSNCDKVYCLYRNKCIFHDEK